MSDAIESFGLRDDAPKKEVENWICFVLGHDFGAWKTSTHKTRELHTDYELRGCRRCTTIQYFSPSGNV